MAELLAEGKVPEVLFWVGCAGSFDDRAKKITKAFVRIMNKAGIEFAVLGTEESCTGDPAKRAGNEFLFQMQAAMNIQVLNGYEIKKIVTTCPHCFNTIKNEYPELGGNYEVLHHTELINSLLEEGRITVESGKFEGRSVTYHDACYLGRSNGIYEVPRSLLKALDIEIKEMTNNRQRGMCCGAGGAQMFKEAEKGNEEVNVARTREALAQKTDFIATGCPFCNTMMTDGVKFHEKEGTVKVLDLAEMIAQAAELE